ncbi:MAG: MarR family transcriptional regulator [Gemmatimonadales bacterium]|nr:MAG: MarR family transcriptional regulator [Gemmatimonadales bacterium]
MKENQENNGHDEEAAAALADRLRRTTRFRSREQWVGISLLRNADLLRRRLTKVVDAEGVTLQQYNVLRILRGAGEAGIPTLSVAERMIERTPGVTRLLDRLEARGWVSRERSSEDRRRVLARITPEGRALLERLDEPLARAEDAAFAALEPVRLSRLGALLEDVRHSLEGPED